MGKISVNFVVLTPFIVALDVQSFLHAGYIPMEDNKQLCLTLDPRLQISVHNQSPHLGTIVIFVDGAQKKHKRAIGGQLQMQNQTVIS